MKEGKNHFIYSNLTLGRRLMVDRHQAIIARRAKRRAKAHRRGTAMLAGIHSEIAPKRAALDWFANTFLED